MSETLAITAVVEDGQSAEAQNFNLDGNPVVEEKTGTRVMANQTLWLGPNHVQGKVQDQIILSRTYPKANGTFYGVMRPEAKRTISTIVDLSDGSTKVVPANISVSASIPVGLSLNDRLRLVNQLVALLNVSSFLEPWLCECKIQNFS